MASRPQAVENLPNRCDGRFVRRELRYVLTLAKVRNVLICPQAPGGTHEELPLPGRPMIGDRLSFFAMTSESADVSQSAAGCNPGTVRGPNGLL